MLSLLAVSYLVFWVLPKVYKQRFLGQPTQFFQQNFPHILLLPARAVHTLKSGQRSNQFRG